MNPVFMDDFLRGCRDCAEGRPHKQFQSQAYDAGYASQYAIEQTVSAQSRGVSQ